MQSEVFVLYINRAMESSIMQISKTFPVLLLTGPRQVGKTTLLQHLAEEGRSYVTLEDPDVRFLAKSDPGLFMQRYAPPLIIDEIQYAPEILPYIKMHVDRSQQKGEFWLTGSQLFHMFFASYVNTYLQRNIRDLTQVADELSFYNFMIAVAARTAKPLIYSELTKDAGISAPTAKRWLSILVSSNHNNVLKRTVKTPLLHFLDTGLCAHLLKWKTPEVLARGAMAGAFFECFCETVVDVSSKRLRLAFFAGRHRPECIHRDSDRLSRA